MTIKNNVGYWLHLGRWFEDPAIWREEIILFLPNGTSLVRRAFGKANEKNAAVGALLKLECIESS